MTTQHTRGPWETDGQAIWAKDNYYITAEIVAGESDEECKANARLMAAAPDLLSALKGLQEIVKAAIDSGDWVVDGSCDPDAQMIRAEKAIAKASGGAT